MPLVNQQWRFVIGYDHWIRFDDRPLALAAKATHRLAALDRRSCLANPFRSVQDDRCELGKEFVKFGIDNPVPIVATKGG